MYTATLASSQSQFGVTVVEFNLNGKDRPSRRMAIKLKTETPDEKDISNVITVIEERCELEYQESLTLLAIPVPTEAEMLKKELFRYSDQAIKEVFAIDDRKLAQIKEIK